MIGSDEARQKLAGFGLVDPTARATAKRKAAPRLQNLGGKRLGLLDNHKGNGDRLLASLSEIFQRDYGVSEIFYRQKFTYGRRATPEMLDELAQNCDLVITAIGD